MRDPQAVKALNLEPGVTKVGGSRAAALWAVPAGRGPCVQACSPWSLIVAVCGWFWPAGPQARREPQGPLTPQCCYDH